MTMTDETSQETLYRVVINDEEQYSIWAAQQPPAGWRIVGEPAPLAECLERINSLWVDMRPASLRRRTAQ
jgi:MbtH protein